NRRLNRQSRWCGVFISKNREYMKRLLGVLLLWWGSWTVMAQGHSYDASGSYSVYQYSVDAGGRTVYLWIPPKCKYVRGVIISLSNLLERNWLEDPLIRRTAAEEGLGIIWVGPGRNTVLT